MVSGLTHRMSSSAWRRSGDCAQIGGLYDFGRSSSSESEYLGIVSSVQLHLRDNTHSLLMSGKSALSSIPPSDTRAWVLVEVDACASTICCFPLSRLDVLPFAAMRLALSATAEFALNVTFAPVLLTVGPRIEVRAFDDGAECSAAAADDGFCWPTSLMVDALVGVGARLKVEGWAIFEGGIIELFKPILDGTFLSSGFFSGTG